jgi:hypothetical protein
MSDYFLVGNLDDDQDLWFVSKKDRIAVPVPKDAWESIISFFQADVVSPKPEDEEARNKIAQGVLDNAEAGNSVSRNVFVAFSANELAKIVMGRRSHPVEQLIASGSELAPVLSTLATRGF